MVDLLDNVSINAIDASTGVISFSTLESYLKSDLRKAKNIYNNQLSLSPNTANDTSHNYFLYAMEDLIDGIDFAILGVQQNDADYIELGDTYIESSTSNISLATSNLRDC